MPSLNHYPPLFLRARARARRERESKLDTFSGFEQFMLLKLDTREAEKKEGEEDGAAVARAGYTEFVSHTVWAHQMDFEEWKRRCARALL